MTKAVEYNGEDVEWNEVIIVNDYDPSKHHTLYVEVAGMGVDMEHVVVRYAAIPLEQVVNASGGSFGGIFDLYDTNEKTMGTISLVITAVISRANDRPEIKGYSTVEGGHREFIEILYPWRYSAHGVAMAGKKPSWFKKVTGAAVAAAAQQARSLKDGD